jgi:hypothetical protein
MTCAPGTQIHSLYSSVTVQPDGALLETRRGYLVPPWIPNPHVWLSTEHWMSYIHPIPPSLQIRPFPPHWTEDQRLCSMFFPASCLEVCDVSAAEIEHVRKNLESYTQILNVLLQIEGSQEQRQFLNAIVKEYTQSLSELLYFQCSGGKPVQPVDPSNIHVFDGFTQQYVDLYMNLETGWMAMQGPMGWRCGFTWSELGIHPEWLAALR